MKEYRAGLIRKIKTVQNQILKMPDEDYRIMLDMRYKKSSTTKLTMAELKDLCSFLDKLAGQTKPKPDKINAQARKIWSLWRRLYELRAIRNGSDLALNQFIKNRCRVKVDSYLWLDTWEASDVIEILKKWILRIEKKEAA